MKLKNLISIGLTVTMLPCSTTLANTLNDGFESNKLIWETCSNQVASNLISLVKNCGTSDFRNRLAIKECISKFDEMTINMDDKFNCAIENSQNNLPPIVSLEILKSIRGEFTKENFLEHSDGKTCGHFAKEDFYEVLETCHGGNIIDRDTATKCLIKINSAQSEFSNINCTIPINDYQSYLYSTEWLESYKLKTKKDL